jgi:hypothetical protein
MSEYQNWLRTAASRAVHARRGVELQHAFVEQVRGEVQQRVEEREQAQHAPKALHVVPAGQLPQRRHRQRDQQQVQRREPAAVQQRAHGIGAQLLGSHPQRAARQQHRRHQGRQEHRRLVRVPVARLDAQK